MLLEGVGYFPTFKLNSMDLARIISHLRLNTPSLTSVLPTFLPHRVNEIHVLIRRFISLVMRNPLHQSHLLCSRFSKTRYHVPANSTIGDVIQSRPCPGQQERSEISGASCDGKAHRFGNHSHCCHDADGINCSCVGAPPKLGICVASICIEESICICEEYRSDLASFGCLREPDIVVKTILEPRIVFWSSMSWSA